LERYKNNGATSSTKEVFYLCYSMVEATLTITRDAKTATPVIKQIDEDALGGNNAVPVSPAFLFNLCKTQERIGSIDILPYMREATGFEVDVELTQDLKTLSLCYGITPFATLLAGWQALLSRFSGQDDIVTANPAANRTCTDVEPLVGLFVNTLALRVHLSNRPTEAELLNTVKQLTPEAQSQQDIPFEQIVEAAGPFRSLSHNPLFQVMTAWQSTLQGSFEAGEPQNSAIPVRVGGKDIPLFVVHEISGEVFYAQLLAEHIDADIPVFGLVDKPPDENLFRTIHAEAKRLVQINRNVQPIGPYRIVGWSLGGILSYEIATQLLGEDETVEFLGLIDTPNFAGTNQKAIQITDHNQLLLNILEGVIDTTDDALMNELEALATTTEFEVFYRICQEKQIFPPNMGIDVMNYYFLRVDAYHHAIADYQPLPIPIPIHLFKAMEEDPSRDVHLGWAKVLPKSQICIIQVPGTHSSVMFPPHIETLGKALSIVLQQANKTKRPALYRHEEHLIAIQPGTGQMPPVFCVPGADANIAAFTHMAEMLESQWPIYGFQPRGLNEGQVPHSSVPAAARAYLKEINKEYPEGPLHLIGHSYGGWVVFEMALQLRAAGREVISVNLIDSEAPESDSVLGREYNRTEILMQLVELSEQSGQCSLNLVANDFEGLDYATQIKLLHERLVEVELIPRMSRPNILRGMLRIFSSNLRTTYLPSGTYPGPVFLILVCDAKDDQETCLKKYQRIVTGWRRFSPGLTTWCGPGNHMTILQPPHVAALAGYLRASLSGTV
jgi:thioesterase domain-containing protein